MGYLVDKYNEAYFLRKDLDGNILPYGVEGIESFIKGDLREHDLEILSRINFSGANVLEFGFGRGETIKYIWEQGASNYTGVDFSEAACSIAKGFLEKFAIVGPKIICSDAIEFARKFSAETNEAKGPSIDVLVMLDFVEHIPRAELIEVLKILRPILSVNAVIVVNTPDFPFDNDVITEGLNEKCMDSSDFIEETKGMHCNRYTLNSLRHFFSNLGYLPISRGHYFGMPKGDESIWHGKYSYRKRWDDARARGIPLRGSWLPEKFEIAYKLNKEVELHRFKNGNLAGISLYVVPTYLEYYDNGNYDQFLINFMSKYQLAGKIIFDLGAFVGVNSMQFARQVTAEGMVCSFEPNPFNADRLALNISENPELSDRIKIYPFALSNERGNTKFKVHSNVDDGLSSASYIEGAHTTLSEQQLSQLGFTDVDVSMVTLDEFVQYTNLIPACLKIDIEGAEHLALAGATQTLIQHHPVLLIELHSIFCAVATLKTIIPLGYGAELLHVEPDGRCFIGAEFVNSQIKSISNLHSLPASNIVMEMKILESEAIKAKLEAATKAKRSLTNELDQQRKQNEQLDLELDQQRKQNEQLDLELDQQRKQNEQLDLELDQQRKQNQILTTSLNRYQTFPMIRLMRKAKVMINSFIHFGKH
ncbi:MAG: FkbM family methyltransferase [Burkholderiales bacterium]|nr:FkbM family methyltransferase [Burkholderiales bacterium]